MLKELRRFTPARVVRNVRRLVDALDRVDSLETKIDQMMVAYQRDARFADRLPAFQARVDRSAVAAHAGTAVANAPMDCDPCPHLLVENIVPDVLYDEMLSALPPQVFFKQETGREEMQVPLPFAPAYSRLVWDCFFHDAIERAIIPAVEDRFGAAFDRVIARYWPRLGSWRESGIALRVTNSRLLLRRPGYEIKPHRDPRWAFVTCLVYLQRRNGEHVYGTQLFRMKHEREPTHSSPFWISYADCELVKDVPGGRNSALIFLNSTGVHAASIPPNAPADLERYVYQVQFGPDEATKRRLIDALSAADRPGWTTKSGAY